MKTHELPMFLASLDQVAEVLGQTLSATRKDGYWLSLQDLSLDTFRGACTLAMRYETFFPVPAVLRDYAKAWRLQHEARLAQATTQEEMLALREALVPPEEIRSLMASVWPEGKPESEPLYDPCPMEKKTV